MRQNEELYKLYKNNDLATTIRLHRLQWAGHGNRIPTKVLFSQMEGKRSLGRPKHRCIGEVARDADNLVTIKRWISIAKGRENGGG